MIVGERINPGKSCVVVYKNNKVLTTSKSKTRSGALNITISKL